LFLFTSANKLLKLSSNAFCSLEITLPNNYCSRPPYVTVKSIIIVLAESFGENIGLERRKVINSANLG